MSLKALVILADGCEDIETVSPVDVLTRVGVDVTVASLDGNPVRAAYGTTLLPHTALNKVSGLFDAIIIPGGKKNALSLAADSRVISLVLEHYRAGKIVAAICAAPSHVLGEAAGILKGKNASGDPGFNDKLAASGAVLTHKPVTVDGKIITASGPGSALSFSLRIAAALVGRDAVRPFAEKWSADF